VIKVFVAASSVVVRSVIKEILLKSEKLEWLGEVTSYSELKTESLNTAADIVICDKTLFDQDRNSTLSDYCHTAELPSVIYYEEKESPSYTSDKVKFLQKPDFINFSEEKIGEYSAYLEQLLFDIKCSSLYKKHLSSLFSISEEGKIQNNLQEIDEKYTKRKYKAVLVGVSTGGPGSILEFLKGIGPNFPLPVIITQHIDSFFDKNLITWLATESSLPVHLAENNIKPLAGHVYLAPSDLHITFFQFPEQDFQIVLSHDEPVNFLRPSVDKMFESAAQVFGQNCIAVILTGMGADGAKGCLHLKELGAYTITQDKESSVIFGMPRAAYEMGASCEVLSLKQIPKRLWNLTGKALSELGGIYE